MHTHIHIDMNVCVCGAATIYYTEKFLHFSDFTKGCALVIKFEIHQKFIIYRNLFVPLCLFSLIIYQKD